MRRNELDTEEHGNTVAEHPDAEESVLAELPEEDAGNPAGETDTSREPVDEADEQETDADELRRLEEERDQYKKALIQERADFENYKKSHSAVAASSFDNGVGAVVVAMLPVLDNFERALAAESSDKAFADGMEMIMRQMRTALEGLGVEEVDTSGHFDPTCHHAVMQTEDPEMESNQVSETLQKGYTLKGKLLRPAMVKVNK